MKNKKWIMAISIMVIIFLVVSLAAMFFYFKFKYAKNIMTASSAQGTLLYPEILYNRCANEGVNLTEYKNEINELIYNTSENVKEYLKYFATKIDMNENELILTIKDFSDSEKEEAIDVAYNEYKKALNNNNVTKKDFCIDVKENQQDYIDIYIKILKEEIPQWYVK